MAISTMYIYIYDKGLCQIQKGKFINVYHMYASIDYFLFLIQYFLKFSIKVKSFQWDAMIRL